MGISIGEDKMKLAKECPKPNLVSKLQSFVRLLQIFWRFVQVFSEVAAALTNLTRKRQSIRDWDDKSEEAFKTLKDKPISIPKMKALDWNLSFRCHIHASQLTAQCAFTVASQDGKHAVLIFFSKTLFPAGENCSSNDRKLLRIEYAVQLFSC